MSLPVFIHRLDMRKTVLSLQEWERCHISSTFTIFKNEQFNDSIHIHLIVYICQCLLRKSYMDALPQCQHRFV